MQRMMRSAERRSRRRDEKGDQNSVTQRERRVSACLKDPGIEKDQTEAVNETEICIAGCIEGVFFRV